MCACCLVPLGSVPVRGGARVSHVTRVRATARVELQRTQPCLAARPSPSAGSTPSAHSPARLRPTGDSQPRHVDIQPFQPHGGGRSAARAGHHGLPGACGSAHGAVPVRVLCRPLGVCCDLGCDPGCDLGCDLCCGLRGLPAALQSRTRAGRGVGARRRAQRPLWVAQTRRQTRLRAWRGSSARQRATRAQPGSAVLRVLCVLCGRPRRQLGERRPALKRTLVGVFIANEENSKVRRPPVHALPLPGCASAYRSAGRRQWRACPGTAGVTGRAVWRLVLRNRSYVVTVS
jgi:hypothetical protein